VNVFPGGFNWPLFTAIVMLVAEWGTRPGDTAE